MSATKFEIKPDVFSIVEAFNLDKDEYNFISIDDFQENIDSILEIANEHVKQWFPKIKRGDVAHFGELSDYRNDGVVIYDGNKLIPLEEDYDEYGHVPEDFTINEPKFHPTYWKDVIAHNDISWLKLDENLIAELKNNLKINQRESKFFPDEEEYYGTTKFTLKGEEYYVYLDLFDIVPQNATNQFLSFLNNNVLQLRFNPEHEDPIPGISLEKIVAVDIADYTM